MPPSTLVVRGQRPDAGVHRRSGEAAAAPWVPRLGHRGRAGPRTSEDGTEHQRPREGTRRAASAGASRVLQPSEESGPGTRRVSQGRRGAGSVTHTVDAARAERAAPLQQPRCAGKTLSPASPASRGREAVPERQCRSLPPMSPLPCLEELPPSPRHPRPPGQPAVPTPGPRRARRTDCGGCGLRDVSVCRQRNAASAPGLLPHRCSGRRGCAAPGTSPSLLESGGLPGAVWVCAAGDRPITEGRTSYSLERVRHARGLSVAHPHEAQIPAAADQQ